MSLELKPCPLCNSPALLERDNDHHGAWFNLGCSVGPNHAGDGACILYHAVYTEDAENEAETILAWNQRPYSSRQEGAGGGEPVEHAPDCQSHIVDVRGRPDECTCGAATSPAEPSGWRPIESAPRDGTYILARVAPRDGDDRWGHLAGRCFVIRHEGCTPSGYDLGWSVFPGFGGTSDSWFEGWLPLPPTSEVRPSPAWLIERGDLAPYPVYLRHTRRGHGWTPDHDEATRFPTKAEAISECCGGNESGPLRVVEHMWVSAPTSEGGENA